MAASDPGRALDELLDPRNAMTRTLFGISTGHRRIGRVAGAIGRSAGPGGQPAGFTFAD
ncbi:hypothetical protein [Blastococcus colisei]|uniref:hypothetical protein n=1 Tax=Blastococcus colisei TaxID=1564162 RepID=UPI001476D2EF|nr:hypothetical protein [Blastococcus colisei]